MRAEGDVPKRADAPEPGHHEEEPEHHWRPADTWLAVLFVLTVLGICATGLWTLMKAAGRMH